MRDEAPRQSDSETPGGLPAAPDATEDGPPPPLNYGILAVLWTAVSAGAVWLLLDDPAWARAPGFLAALRAVRLEQWLAVGLLGVHLRWLWGAWRP
ncbi:MAG: hypothetical protein J0L84_19325 [Verrucomicrobia bacterium]|nr:hypothetical protein [Verrucomicrobiota bacterium]